MINLRIDGADRLPICPVTFSYNRRTYTKMRIAYNPIFQAAKTIELKSTDPSFKQMLQVLNGEIDQVSILIAEDTVRLAREVFQTRLNINTQYLGTALLSLAAAKQSSDSLDVLSTPVLCSAISYAISVRSNQISQWIDKYINETFRTPQDKKFLQSIISGNRYGQSKAQTYNRKQKDVKIEAEVYRPKHAKNQQKEPEPPRGKTTKKNRQKVERAESKAKGESPQPKEFKEVRQVKQEAEEVEEDRRGGMTRNQKRKWEEMIALGLYGQFTQNWRQRYRPSKQPSKKVQPAPAPPKQFQSRDMKLPVVFEYPKNGQTFDFSTLKFPVLMNIQPQNIELRLQNDQITILRQSKGFKRKTDYRFVQNGLLAEGLTLLLGGMTNIEDGGQVINSANPQDICGNCGWIVVRHLAIYQL